MNDPALQRLFRLHFIWPLLLLALLLTRAQPAVAGGDYTLHLPLARAQSNLNLPVPFGPTHSGEGTYYYATGEGNCLFPASPENMMVAAMNEADYALADYCGAYIRVQGPNGSVDVRIVDRCPECAAGDVDLSLEAFAEIAPVSAGRVPISWQLLSYPVAGPIRYHFKDGSNPWWVAIQVRNHRNPIARFEVFVNGAYQTLPRQQWNYFLASGGLGSGPFTFRVTDILGNVLVDSGVPLLDNAETSGSGQFPPP